jgi:uncharacterized membrane protein
MIMSKKTGQNHSAPHNSRATKKAAVLGSEKKSPALKAIAVVGVILAIGILLWLNPFGAGKDDAVATTPAAVIGKETVTHPVSLFTDGKARHFTYQLGDLTVRYFVLKSSDGIIRAAFDACDVCWPANKGYFQQGDVMVCRNCGRKFASVRINEVKGGCNPAPLNRRIQGDQLVIAVQDIMTGRAYFDFSRKG